MAHSTKLIRPQGGDTLQFMTGAKVLQDDGTQPAAIADAAGGATVDAEARTAINALLAVMRTLGFIQT